MNRTAWSKQSSSFPSDRIRPSPPPPPPSKNGKAKGKGVATEPPKSKAVRQLETLKSALSASSSSRKSDPKGGCFCQARHHPLSTYTPICKTCGLIQCEINLPQYTCPHCSADLLSNSQRGALITRLETQIADTLTKEALARERAVQDARRAVGEFPTLSGRPGGATPPSAPQTRSVMSLNSKTGKVSLSSFTTTPVSSRPASRAESVEEEPIRVPPPPADVPHCEAAKIDTSRPWRDLSGQGAVYIAAPLLDSSGADGNGGSKRRRKAKAKENRDGGEGGEASGSGSVAPPATIVD
ncbi:hypothetical protein FB45DRAFT_947921 [Roridomyces roridus]|uniref:TRIP4/RQT4 C2HC5-type zinc finger domain-containing protein n=1 Tax=Roridomyces roridus TaxID=1738132 RepID=A0AAD7B145_9AGAR|nr:hypothetical protein FB45DRAFT_947921 [Roridomyces roridus]